jgi:hypothetical protein
MKSFYDTKIKLKLLYEFKKNILHMPKDFIDTVYLSTQYLKPVMSEHLLLNSNDRI